MGASYQVVGIGELLWDLLPAGKQLGGAPMNFGYHVALLGDEACIASRLGSDLPGSEIRERFAAMELADEWLQSDDSLPTGTVDVAVDAAGEPTYVIREDVAWDAMAWTAAWKLLAAQADAVCCGSLAQRSPASREAIQTFLSHTRAGCLVVFDVNLRQHFYSAEVLASTLQRATVVKLNRDELPVVMKLLDVAPTHLSLSAQAQALRERYSLELVCVTRGAEGCVLMAEGHLAEHPGFPTTVADAVGAGDAFTAALTWHYLRGTPLTSIAAAANRHGAWVSGCHGGTPEPDPEILAAIRRP